MNKKLNTVIFMAAGTIVNLALIIGIFLALLLLFNRLYTSLPDVGQGLSMLAIFVSLAGGVAGGFFIYTKLVKWITRKWNLDERIEPLFRSRRR